MHLLQSESRSSSSAAAGGTSSKKQDCCPPQQDDEHSPPPSPFLSGKSFCPENGHGPYVYYKLICQIDCILTNECLCLCTLMFTESLMLFTSL